MQHFDEETYAASTAIRGKW